MSAGIFVLPETLIVTPLTIILWSAQQGMKTRDRSKF